jgi:hypothetical protein
MERFKVSQVAKMLGITATAVYRKFKTSSELVRNHVHKEKGITYLDSEGLEMLKASMQKAPTENENTCRIEPVQNLVETLQKELDRKQSVIESLIAQNEAQRQRSDTIILKLTNDVGNLQKALEYRPPESMPVTTSENNPTPSEARRADPPPAPRQVIVSQRQVSMLESVQIIFSDVMTFVFGVDLGRKAV